MAHIKLSLFLLNLGLVSGIIFFFSSCVKSSSNLEVLPVEDYLKKPDDFLGNNYLLRAQIVDQIKWEKNLGRVLAVRINGSDIRLPIFVPEAVTDNLHVGQRYEFEAIIEQGGLIYVEALYKY